MKKTFIIALIITLAISQKLVLVKSITNNLLDANYPDCFQNIPKAQLSLQANDNLKNIWQIIKSWTPSSSLFTLKDSQILSQANVVTENGNCKVKHMSFQQKVSHVTNSNINGNILFPGNLIHNAGQSLINSIIPVYISDQFRNSWTIRLCNGINKTITDTRNISSYRKQINQILSENINYLNSQPISVYVKNSSEISQFIKYYGLSAKAFSSLGLDQYPTDLNKFKNGKIVISLFQKYFSAAVDFVSAQNQADKKAISGGPTQNPILVDNSPSSKNVQSNSNTLKSDSGSDKGISLLELLMNGKFTIDELFRYNAWGPNNLPSIISQANYGRLLVMTVDDTIDNQQSYEQLLSCFNNGFDSVTFDKAMNAIQKSRSLKFYTRGIANANSLIKNGPLKAFFKSSKVDWKKYFALFDQSTQFESIQPTSAKALNFLGQTVGEVEGVKYLTSTCDRKNQVIIKVVNIKSSFTARLSKTDQNSCKEFLFTSSKAGDMFDISNKVENKPFYVKLTVQSKKSGGFGVSIFKTKVTYSNNLQFIIQLNGKQILRAQAKNEKDSQEYRDYLIEVDPRKATAKRLY